LKTEFENVYSIIKLSLTLPTSSCSVERSFSKLKIIKSRLRSTKDQKRLENLMVISCEHDVSIDISKVININFNLNNRNMFLIYVYTLLMK